MRTKSKRKRKKPKYDAAWYKKKLWAVFTLYIKNRDDWTCFTCGKRGTGWGMGGGHFIPKGSAGLSLYFHEDNVHAQCTHCNLVLEGNHYEYGKRLGEAKVQELYALRNKIEKWTIQDFKDKIAH